MAKDLENYYKSDEYNNRQIHERAMERYYGPGETKGPMEKGNDLYKEATSCSSSIFSAVSRNTTI
jgi:hypothetical protein